MKRNGRSRCQGDGTVLAEKAVLGAMLLNPERAHEVYSILGTDGEVFLLEQHKRIYSTIASMVRASVAIDPAILISRLEEQGCLDECGGPAYISDLSAAVPTSSHARDYAAAVIDAHRRRMIGVAIDRAKRAHDQGRSLEAIVAPLQPVVARFAHRAQCVNMADVASTPVEWLWAGYLARGKITMLDGDPGASKSTLTCDWAARVTTGEPFPGEQTRREPANVLMLTGEDGLADTIRPRLEAHGAVLRRVIAITGVPDVGGGERPFEIPKDLPLLGTHLEQAALLILDPLMAFLDGKVDSHRDHDVRRAIHAITRMAEHYNVATVIVRHLTKTKEKNAIYRGGGSIGIIGAARIGLLLGADPSDETRRILAVTKCNLAPKAPSWAYRINTHAGFGVGVVGWEAGPCHLSPRDLLADGEEHDRGHAVAAAESFLRNLLADGPVRVALIRKEASEAGIAWPTVRRAALRIQILKVKRNFGNGYWDWQLPREGDQDRFEGDQSRVVDHLRENGAKMPLNSEGDQMGGGDQLRAEVDHHCEVTEANGP